MARFRVDLIATLQKFLSVSKHVRINLLRKHAGMDKERFLDDLVEWATEYKFVNRGDIIVPTSSDTSSFVQEIDAVFGQLETTKRARNPGIRHALVV